MKKIYYLLTWMAVAITFMSCHPLNKTYNALDGLGKPKQTLNYTMQAADYVNTSIFPATSAVYKAKGFINTADANANIPTFLNYKFFDYGNGSNANITFTPLSSSIVEPDSVFKDVSYTLTPADYLLLPGNKYADFSIAQVLSWLPYKYPTPLANQLAVLTYTVYPSVPSPGTGTYSFLYLNGAWIQAYQITPAQYTAVGRGQYNQFTSADDATLVAYLNGILKADIGLMATAKYGTTEYVSFNYYSSAKITSQRVLPLVFDGNNWGRTSATNTLTFIQSNGSWIPDPTVYYTLTKADTQLIGNPNGTNNTSIGTAAQRANLYQYGDFSGWAVADLDKAMILALTTDFPNPKLNITYKVTFLLYSGKDVPTTYGFSYNGTAWTAQQ